MWVCGCVRVDIEGCEGFPGAWRPSPQLDLQPLSIYCELVSGTWAITREVTAPHPPTPGQFSARVFPISADILSRLSSICFPPRYGD